MANPPNPWAKWTDKPFPGSEGKDGSKESERSLADIAMGDFFVAVREGRVPDPEVMTWVADAFWEILSGADANIALCRTKKRGRKPRFDLATEVAKLVVRQGSARGAISAAINKVAMTQRVSPSLVEKAWLANRKEALLLIETCQAVESMEREEKSPEQLKMMAEATKTLEDKFPHRMALRRISMSREKGQSRSKPPRKKV